MSKKSPLCGPLCGPVSPAGGRAHRALFHRGPGDHRPGGDPVRILPWDGPLPLRAGQKNAAGQRHGRGRRRRVRPIPRRHGRRYGVGGGGGLYPSDLF